MFNSQSAGNDFSRNAKATADMVRDEAERGFAGGVPFSEARLLRHVERAMKCFPERVRRHEQTTGEFVGVAFEPVVFGFRDA